VLVEGRVSDPLTATGSDGGAEGPGLVVVVGPTAALAAAAGLGAAVGSAAGTGVCAAVGAIVGRAVGAGVGGGAVSGRSVGVAVGAGEAVDTGPQVDRMIVSLIRVTVPFRARARPFTVTPLFIVMEVRARMVPTKVEPDPRLAELVTCQNTGVRPAASL
jgi:hypothetical protein